jgi:hypothetical protein
MKDVLTQEEIQHIDARGERQRELDCKAGLPDWRDLENKVSAAIKSVSMYQPLVSATLRDDETRRTLEAREVVAMVIMPLLRERCHEDKQLRDVVEGLLMEWDKLTRYGSPMAKAANERVAAARKLLVGE